MKREMNVDIVIPVNSDAFIEKCIQSLLNQNYTNYRIIIVKNGKCNAINSLLSKYENRIKLLFCEKEGAYSSRNKGIKESIADVIAFTDSDCFIDEQWLNSINKAFNGHPDIAALQGRSDAFNMSLVSQGILKYYEKTFKKFVISDSQSLYCGRVDTRNCAIKREVFLKVGMFNENLKFWGDAEMGERLVEANFKIMYNPSMIVFHNNLDEIFRLIDKRKKEGYIITYDLRKCGIKYVKKYFPEMLFVFFCSEIIKKRKKENEIKLKELIEIVEKPDIDNKIFIDSIENISITAFLAGTFEARMEVLENKDVCIEK